MKPLQMLPHKEGALPLKAFFVLPFLAFMLTLITFPVSLSAEENYRSQFPKYSGSSTLDIWNSNTIWVGRGNFGYVFTIDTIGLDSGDISEIANLTITTNYGDIVFDEPLMSCDACRYPEALLETPQGDITEIKIIKAVVGAIEGQPWTSQTS